MNIFPLCKSEPNQWYEVVDGKGFLRDGITILFEGITPDGKYFTIGDHSLEETGHFLTQTDAESVMVKKLIFE